MIQFYHSQLGFRATICVNTPDKSTLKQMLASHSNQTVIQIGLSVLSPNDQYEKAVGRKLSQERIVDTISTLCNIKVDGIKFLYHFKVNDYKFNNKSYMIYFKVSDCEESDRVPLLNVWVTEN